MAGATRLSGDGVRVALGSGDRGESVRWLCLEAEGRVGGQVGLGLCLVSRRSEPKSKHCMRRFLFTGSSDDRMHDHDSYEGHEHEHEHGHEHEHERTVLVGGYGRSMRTQKNGTFSA